VFAKQEARMGLFVRAVGNHRQRRCVLNTGLRDQPRYERAETPGSRPRSGYAVWI